MPWRWDTIHQQELDNVKSTIAKDAVLAHLEFTESFKIYTIHQCLHNAVGSGDKSWGQAYCVLQQEINSLNAMDGHDRPLKN